MIQFSFSTTTLALFVALVSSSQNATLAQGLIDTIPKDQPPLSRTFPPTSTEQTPTGTGKFVIFTREATDKTNEWDFIAGAWECIPSRPHIPITKRIEFGHSAGNAEPLLDCLVRDNCEDLFPQFVTLHVGAFNLYDINYRTWDVRCLRQGKSHLSTFGVMKNFIFCRDLGDSDDWFLLDTTSGNTIKEVPFIPLDVDGPFWLVRKTAEKSGAWSYHVAKEEFIGHFNTVDESQFLHSQSSLSADGRNRAWILIPKPDTWHEGPIAGTFLLQRHGNAEDIRVPVVMMTKPIRGSGRLMPVGTHLSFTKDETIEFSARRQIKGRKERIWAIEIVSGKATESERPYVEAKPDDFAVFDGVPAPEYLRKYLKDLWHFGRGGLAPAFLMHLGILKKQPEFPACTAGVSRDGRHIFYKAKEGPLADVFIYGDLQTKQTVRWHCPAGIKRGDSLEFVWVETP